MSGKVKNRVCIVTGAAQGIGATYAKALAAEGAKLVVSDIDDASEVVSEIVSFGGEAIALQNDVSDWQSCQDMASATMEAFGRIDVLINNAAIFGKLDRASIDEISPELFQEGHVRQCGRYIFVFQGRRTGHAGTGLRQDHQYFDQRIFAELPLSALRCIKERGIQHDEGDSKGIGEDGIAK